MQALPRVVGEANQERERQVQEVAVRVLDDQRQRIFAQVALARLAHRASWRIGPERLLVGSAVVIASQAEPRGCPQDEQRRRERQEGGEPAWLRPEPSVRPITEQLG